MTKKQFNLVIDLFKHPKFQHFLLATHENPDGDAIGSMLALGLTLERLKKRVTYFCPHPLPANLKFLPQSAKVLNRLVKKKYDVLVALDAGAEKRLGFKRGSITFQVSVNIDHHSQAKLFGNLNLISAQASSTAEIVYFLTRELTVKDIKIATCLLTGIFTDTGSFQHANTTPQTMEIASDLMKQGANLPRISRETYCSKSLPALKIWGRALARARQDKKRGITLSAITLKDFSELGALPEDLDGVVNIINSAEGTRYALLLSEQEKNKIRASLRSESGRGVNVAKIAARYGGGGHPLASGFTIKGRLARRGKKWIIKK